jgi:hypothetical protein
MKTKFLAVLFLAFCSVGPAQTKVPLPFRNPPAPAPQIRETSENYTVTAAATSAFTVTLSKVPVVGTVLTVYRNFECVLVKNVEASATPAVLQVTASGLVAGDVLTFVYSTAQ